jgi:hypothetical protein
VLARGRWLQHPEQEPYVRWRTDMLLTPGLECLVGDPSRRMGACAITRLIVGKDEHFRSVEEIQAVDNDEAIRRASGSLPIREL